MRPPEQNVTLCLYQLICNASEDAGGDEPYLWILGFKVDAETLGPPQPGSLVPSLNVQVFKGIPASPFVLGPDDEVHSGQAPVGIPAALGTRGFRLKPALLPLAGWFPGIAGMVCLLWDQDNFDPGTAEAGQNRFNELFGPALSRELNALLNGDYDDTLSRNANGAVVSVAGDQVPLVWRLDRLRDPEGRKNAIKAVTRKVKDEIINRVRSAIIDAAGWDELFDPDDLLGVDAQVFLGDELQITRHFSLSFTDDEADYIVKGYGSGSRVHVARLDGTLTEAIPTFDRNIGLWLQVCWFGEKLYWANAFRLKTKTRFELRSTMGGMPSSVRWFINDFPLPEGEGSLGVTFESVDGYEGPPQDALASYYSGGPGLLNFRAEGPNLEVANVNGEGVFAGKVRALFAFPGDPSLFPSAPGTPAAELWKLGYVLEDELVIVAVDLEMSDDYYADIKRCKRVTDEIDRKHLAVILGKAKINPGDPPPFRQALLDRVTSAAKLANAVGLDGAARQYSLKQNFKDNPARSQPVARTE